MLEHPPAFYARITRTLYRGSLPPWQRTPIAEILAEGLRRERNPVEAAYVLATAHHETGRFRFMEEIGQGKGRDYGRPVTLIRGRTATYYGRGYVQLTWLQNYARMGLKLGLNLVETPDLARQPDIAARILWEGMIAGDFTGKALSDYLPRGALGDRALGADYFEAFVAARRIVNGTDRAELIAGYAVEFLEAMRGGA